MTLLDALPDDFRDLLVELADAGAEFVLIGGWAMAVHGRPRATEDLDILVRAEPVNATRVHAALSKFGAPLSAHGVGEHTFALEGQAYRVGRKPNLAELLTKVSGVTYDEAAKDPIAVSLDGRIVRVIGREALLKNKRAAGRPKDLDDVTWLERVGRDE
jgi:predicted nucleotidyltransferase